MKAFWNSPTNNWFQRFNHRGHIIRSYFAKKLVRNKNITIFSDNCMAGFIYHDLGLRFNSPFINGLCSTKDFLKFLHEPKYYLNQPLVFIPNPTGEKYPVAMIGDIRYNFIHYHSEEEALQKWEERKARIIWDNVYVIMTEKEDCTYNDLCSFNTLQSPFIKKKVVLCHKPYPEIKNAFYIRSFEDKPYCGIISDYKIGQLCGTRYYNDFNFINWINQ